MLPQCSFCLSSSSNTALGPHSGKKYHRGRNQQWMGTKQEVRKAKTKQQPKKTRCDPFQTDQRDAEERVHECHLSPWELQQDDCLGPTANSRPTYATQKPLPEKDHMVKVTWEAAAEEWYSKPTWTTDKFNASVHNNFNKLSSRPEENTKDRSSNRKKYCSALTVNTTA